MDWNHLIEKQRADRDSVFTLVQFDAEYEFVHKAVPIGEVPRRACSSGMTLLDAVGRSIAEVNRLKRMPASDRPGLVVFVIVTDGQVAAMSSRRARSSR